MRINDITIKNFRGFDDRFFEFDSKMNVVLGNNTTGKTTLLHAVQIALGAYLQSMTLLPKEWTFRRNFVATDRVQKYNDAKDDFMYLADANPKIEVNATLTTEGKNDGTVIKETDVINWYREAKGNTTIHSKKNIGELSNIVNKWVEYRSSENRDTDIILPIVLAFGADRIDNNYKHVVNTEKNDSRIAKAYKFALAETVDFKSALDWYYKFDSTAKKSKEEPGTDKAFEEALERAAKLQNIARDSDNRGLWADVTVTGKPTERLKYEMMSSGFKAMVNLVSEIAYRCIMLNRWLGADAVKKTPGVVMIDEVELYLHPHWQQHVLADLQDAFPNIQFIVTTHSPFIAQSVNGNNVVVLDGTSSSTPSISPNNRGVEEILACEMGMQGMLRSEVYRKKQDLATKYFELVKAGKEGSAEIEHVKSELNKLELEAGLLHDPAYESFLKLNRGRL